jgi:hypothetical protein
MDTMQPPPPPSAWRIRPLSALVATLATVAVIGFLIFLWVVAARTVGVQRVVNPPAVVRQVQQLSELATIQYRVQKAIGLREQRIPLGSESLLLIVQAEVLAGIDLKDLREDDIQVFEQGRRVVVRLPEPRILRVYIDDEETRVWDRRVTWWTPWVPPNPGLERQARLTALEDVRRGALEMGILDHAERKAQDVIRALLQVMGAEEVMFAPT